jgi:hypothetical protein
MAGGDQMMALGMASCTKSCLSNQPLNLIHHPCTQQLNADFPPLARIHVGGEGGNVPADSI